MSDARIQLGDVVSVSFHGSRFTLVKCGVVMHVPQATGDQWVVSDVETEALHHISEGCTVTRLKGGSVGGS